jgi:hypothetical protein
MLWYNEDSFVSINAAHDLDRVYKATIVVKGKPWIISSKISIGSVESITWVLAKRWWR